MTSWEKMVECGASLSLEDSDVRLCALLQDQRQNETPADATRSSRGPNRQASSRSLALTSNVKIPQDQVRHSPAP